MPERAINTKNATGCLLILLPAAMAMSALFVAWPLILGVTLLVAGGNLWQNFEWAKTVRSIDPVFQQLIVHNRGEITPIDLSLNANISGNVAHRYLAAKADEFGTGSRQHPDRGQIYYFVSVSTLGSIFDDSELAPPEIMPATTPIVAPQSPAIPTAAPAEVAVQSEPPAPTVAAAPTIPVDSTPTPQVDRSEPKTAPVKDKSLDLRQLFDEDSTPVNTDLADSPVADPPQAAPPPDRPLVTIIQSELAKRLDVHSSTIYKRRSEPDFTDWTRNRDPEGLGWGYAEATKEYYRLDS
jgi:hypothetical protein